MESTDMISGKVWGSTSQILKTPFVEFHRIVVNTGYKCSKHKHEHKWNAFYVESGVLEVHVFKNDYDLTDVTTLKDGEFMTIRPGEYHYFVGKTSDVGSTTVAFEIYYPEPLSKDIIRETVGGPGEHQGLKPGSALYRPPSNTELDYYEEVLLLRKAVAELEPKKDDNNNIPPITNSFGTSYPKDSPGWRAFAKTRGELNNQFDSMVEGRNEEDNK